MDRLSGRGGYPSLAAAAVHCRSETSGAWRQDMGLTEAAARLRAQTRARRQLQLDWVPAGVGANGDDNINYQGIVAKPSPQSDFSHPICKIGGVDGVSGISAGLPPTRK